MEGLQTILIFCRETSKLSQIGTISIKDMCHSVLPEYSLKSYKILKLILFRDANLISVKGT